MYKENTSEASIVMHEALLRLRVSTDFRRVGGVTCLRNPMLAGV